MCGRQGCSQLCRVHKRRLCVPPRFLSLPLHLWVNTVDAITSQALIGIGDAAVLVMRTSESYMLAPTLHADMPLTIWAGCTFHISDVMGDSRTALLSWHARVTVGSRSGNSWPRDRAVPADSARPAHRRMHDAPGNHVRALCHMQRMSADWCSHHGSSAKPSSPDGADRAAPGRLAQCHCYCTPNRLQVRA